MSVTTPAGQEITGVNDGSRNSTLVADITDAWTWGAEMFCKCEVRLTEKVQDDRGGYLVYFAWHATAKAEVVSQRAMSTGI
jgi:hypothetical protein